MIVNEWHTVPLILVDCIAERGQPRKVREADLSGIPGALPVYVVAGANATEMLILVEVNA